MNPCPDPADNPTRCTRVLRRLRKAGLVLLLLLTAFYLIENWRGARAWKTAQARLAAAGESLDLKALEPPWIAPEANRCDTRVKRMAGTDCGRSG
jgi:hypothetical protein